MGDAKLGDIAGWLVENQNAVLGVLTIIATFILWRFHAVRAHGLDHGGRDVTPIPPILWVFAAGTTLFAYQLGGAAAVELGFATDTVHDRAMQTLLSGIAGTIVGGGLLWFAAREAKDAGLIPKWGDWPIGVGLFLVLYPIVSIVGLMGLWTVRGLNTVPQDRIAHDTLQLIAQHQGDSWVWVLSGVVVVLVPIVEELVYRVFLQSAFLRVFRSRWGAVLLTSVIFAGMHWTVLPDGGKYAIAQIFALSVALGAAYERTGKLGVPIAMHASFNAFNLLVTFLVDPMVQG